MQAIPTVDIGLSGQQSFKTKNGSRSISSPLRKRSVQGSPHNSARGSPGGARRGAGNRSPNQIISGRLSGRSNGSANGVGGSKVQHNFKRKTPKDSSPPNPVPSVDISLKPRKKDSEEVDKEAFEEVRKSLQQVSDSSFFNFYLEQQRETDPPTDSQNTDHEDEDEENVAANLYVQTSEATKMVQDLSETYQDTISQHDNEN